MITTQERIKLPPQNVEAEEAILGGVLLDPEALLRVLDLLKPEFFYLPSHQIIYRVMVELYHQGKATDLMTVTTCLGDRGLLEKVGGQMKIASLVERTISAANIDQYAALVADKFVRRRLIAASSEINESAYNQALDLAEILNTSEEKIFSLTQHRPQSDMISIGDCLVDNIQFLDSLADGTRQPGIATGLYDLDAITGGLHRSDLVIIAGRPAMGKTSIALNIARKIANDGLPVGIFSLEMSREQLTNRLLTDIAGIESDKLRTGKLSQYEWGRVIDGVSALSEEPIFIDDTTDVSVNEIRSKARRLQAENGGKLGLVLVDYLQLMNGTSNNRVQDLAQITRGFKILAKELDVPVILLSQLSRGVESRTDKRPNMADLRDSGSIEQDADLILMLYREEYYNPETPDRGVAEVIISKHRNGPTGTIKLLFQPEFTRFRNLATSKSKRAA